ncbi:MAG TPA: hypothetical protein VGC80_05500, partial [Acetobacteraceae bacterium]
MPLYRPTNPALWRVSQALAVIRALLADRPEGGALAAFLPPLATDAPNRPLQARAALATIFLAGLELARNGQIRLKQAVEFGAVTLFAANARGRRGGSDLTTGMVGTAVRRRAERRAGPRELRPCQDWGRGFESLRPLQSVLSQTFSVGFRASENASFRAVLRIRLGVQIRND